jgi:nucleotide-binding universal stress UspA family protein
MKSLLVPVLVDADNGPAFSGALSLARGSGAHLSGVANQAAFTGSAGEFFGEADIAYVQQRMQEIEDEGRRLFVAAMEAAGLAAASLAAPGAGYAWIGRDRAPRLSVPEVARAFDMTVVGLPGARPASGATLLLESCLFESGQPVLVMPPQWDKPFGDTISIAWNGSSETARTIASAEPFLHRAKSIVVVEVEGVGVPGPDAKAVAAQLMRHGLKVDVRTAPLNGRNPGQAFLEESEKLGADLMVKGAYTQSRLRQMIFGGATAFLLKSATMPMVMAH